MNRRQFTFWLGFGLFSLSEKFSAAGLDALAAAMRSTEAAKSTAKRSGAEHWTLGGNKEWRWFERENLVKGEWVLTGRTTPINQQTGKRKAENIGYLDDSLVPAELRDQNESALALAHHDASGTEETDNWVEPADHVPVESGVSVVDLDPQLPTAKRRSRHGRPPSKWLRSLHADEIRVWLKTVELPEAGVSGMTVWIHLTRDHAFDAERIKGLTVPEQDKLHAAAHYGY